MTLILHCGGREATWEDVCQVKMPDETSSYQPVSHGDFYRLCIDRARTELGSKVELETQFGLNKDGNQLFFKISAPNIRDTSDRSCLSIGGRNSYDKSMSVGFAIGFHVFVCDNMAFTSSHTKFVRAHTGNVWEAIETAVMKGMARAEGAMLENSMKMDKLEECAVEDDDVFRMIGLAQGRQILMPNQANVAYRAWRKPKFEEFEARNAWSAHNALTEAGKTFSPAKIMGRLVDLDRLVDQELVVKELLAADHETKVEGVANELGLRYEGDTMEELVDQEDANQRDREVSD